MEGSDNPSPEVDRFTKDTCTQLDVARKLSDNRRKSTKSQIVSGKSLTTPNKLSQTKVQSVYHSMNRPGQSGVSKLQVNQSNKKLKAVPKHKQCWTSPYAERVAQTLAPSSMVLRSRRSSLLPTSSQDTQSLPQDPDQDSGKKFRSLKPLTSAKLVKENTKKVTADLEPKGPGEPSDSQASLSPKHKKFTSKIIRKIHH